VTELAPAVYRGLESDVLGEKVLLEDRCVRPDQLLCVPLAGDLDQPDKRLDRLAQVEIGPEGRVE
jgi:hypothetical protein